MALADRGCSVVAYDIDATAVDNVNAGRMPFLEPGADEVMPRVRANGSFSASADPRCIAEAEVVVVVVGTPVDEHLNPDAEAVPKAVLGLKEHLSDSHLIVLRSTVFPGVTRMVEKRLAEEGLTPDISFCPERIAEGKAFTELFSLPQIVSGCSPRAVERASALFGHLTESIVETTPEEAELAKLFTNTWRYIKFAAANQFFTIANDFGVDFEQVRRAITFDYPRAADMPGAGFAAGPCLFKDTMQLAAFHNNNFTLGHASMAVNEGLPLYVVSRLEQNFDLATTSVGILGMAFKAGSDDTRASLSYKLRRILRFKAKEVLCTDENVTTDASLVSLDEVLSRADVLVVGTPHDRYRSLSPHQPVLDIWNVLGRGTRI